MENYVFACFSSRQTLLHNKDDEGRKIGENNLVAIALVG